MYERFFVTFATKNASFEKDLAGTIAEVLVGIAKRVANGEVSGFVLDTNGSTVGSFALTWDK